MAAILALWLVLAPALSAASEGPVATASASPRWAPAPEPPGPILALALAPAGSAGSAASVGRAAQPRIAVADARTVWVGPANGRLAPVHRARDVRELVFAPDGGLWIASAEGLWRWRPEGARRVLAPRPGARARDVHRIRRAGPLWVAATGDGVHVRSGDETWRSLGVALPTGAATALAVGRDAARVRLGVVVDGVAHWLDWPADAPPGEGATRWARVGEPGDGRRSAADVWLAQDGGTAWTLLRDGCLVGPERVCPALPPGARAERLFHAAGRFWLATGRGLLVAATPTGPWQREAAPLGSLATHAVAGDADLVLAGTERGLHVARTAGVPAAGAVADLPPRLLGEHGEPGIDEVRRAALAYLELGAGRLRALRRGAARRGWLPTLSFRVDRDRAAGRSADHDEVFVSGAHRALFDRERDSSRAFELSLELEWDLGDVLHHPESVDVSREVRELVELRDDVLDEVHHLYYERRRVLLELLVLPPGRALEAARLRLRADELAAGIDAWTGGWFGRRAVRLAP